MYNEAFVLTMDDGQRVIGKVPNPNAGISYLTTASEVATMDFVRLPSLDFCISNNMNPGPKYSGNSSSSCILLEFQGV